MTTGDYGRDVAFGLFPSPEADPRSLETLWAQVAAADRGGLDLVGIQDHPYQRRHLDTWMLMATVLAHTERVRVFPDVANVPLRPPAVMATSAASLDVLCQTRSVTSFSSASSDWDRPVSIPEATMPSRSSTLWKTVTEV